MTLVITPMSVQQTLAARAREARLRIGWSRTELAHRSGVSSATIREFERTGRIGLSRLLAIAGSLRALDQFGDLFPAPPAESLDELERRAAAPRRQRGRTVSAPPTPKGRKA